MMKLKDPGDLQDGMLAYYLGQAKASDVNVERRIEKEPFFVNDYLKQRIEESSAGKAISQSEAKLADYVCGKPPADVFPGKIKQRIEESSAGKAIGQRK